MKSGASVLAVLVGEPPVLLHLYDISPLVLPPPATLISDFLSVQRRQHRPLTSALFQVLLSQVHRLRALDLLGRFLDLGPWAVSLVRFLFCCECLKNNTNEIITLHPVLSTGGRERHVSFKRMPLTTYIIVSLLKGNMKLSLFLLI